MLLNVIFGVGPAEITEDWAMNRPIVTPSV